MNKLQKLKNLKRILEDVRNGSASQKDLAMLETMENQSGILEEVLVELKREKSVEIKTAKVSIETGNLVNKIDSLIEKLKEPTEIYLDII